MFIHKKEDAITVIALIIVIIILLILAGISLTFALGNEGIITQARWSSFVTELSSIKEKIILKEQDNVIQSYQSQKVDLIFSQKPDKSIIPFTLQKELEVLGGQLENLYYVPKELANNKENTYLYEDRIKVVFKIKGIYIWGTTIHSIEAGNKIKDNSTNPDDTIHMEVEAKTGYYEPDLNGFDKNNTYIIYYNEDCSKTNEVLVKDYLQTGKQQKIEKQGEIYTFYEYTTQADKSVWGNIKTYANGQEAWWVWIPRYAYSIKTSAKTTQIEFTDIHNQAFSGADLTNYIQHPAFSTGEKELKGIWMSKYNPSSNSDTIKEDSNYIYQECLAPDLSGFDPENTYLIKYDETGNNVIAEDLIKNVEITTYNNDKKWYNYGKKRWGNVKTYANGQEAWWVWVPRYAYSIIGRTGGIDVIFLDENDRPFDIARYPNGLPDIYTVHPAFNQGNKKLKGIWMSKYNPSGTATQEEITMIDITQ